MSENTPEKLNNLRGRNNNFENIVVYSFKAKQRHYIQRALRRTCDFELPKYVDKLCT